MEICFLRATTKKMNPLRRAFKSSNFNLLLLEQASGSEGQSLPQFDVFSFLKRQLKQAINWLDESDVFEREKHQIVQEHRHSPPLH